MSTCRRVAHGRSRSGIGVGRGVACVAALLAAATGTAAAQLISMRTVPIARADRFAFLPSRHLGMGGVSLALADTLSDLAVNPATGARLTGARFFASPVVYSVSENAGGGRALPVGVIARSGSWFAGGAVAFQMVDAAQPGFGGGVVLDAGDGFRTTAAQVGDPSRAHGNGFAFATLGKVWPGTGLSVGGSVLVARRAAVDGVDLLYSESGIVDQSGHAVDVRLGLLKEWGASGTLEALALYSRSRMTHDVAYFDPFWDPATQRTVLRTRSEQERDATHVWGLHLAYERPLTAAGWRIGWIATANRMTYPDVPSVAISSTNVPNVPWNPGHAQAYNIGVGLSRTNDLTQFGIDAFLEPIWSHTWSEAETPTATRLGHTIPAGGTTVENDFLFSNALFRMGVGHELVLGDEETAAGVQLGLAVRRMHYWLAQYDFVQAAGRNEEEEWMEWTPTWGLSVRFPAWEIRYHGLMTSGTKRPGVVRRVGFFVAEPSLGGPFLPGRPLQLGGVSLVTHQVSVSLPLGRASTPGGVP